MPDAYATEPQTSAVGHPAESGYLSSYRQAFIQFLAGNPTEDEFHDRVYDLAAAAPSPTEGESSSDLLDFYANLQQRYQRSVSFQDVLVSDTDLGDHVTVAWTGFTKTYCRSQESRAICSYALWLPNTESFNLALLALASQQLGLTENRRYSELSIAAYQHSMRTFREEVVKAGDSRMSAARMAVCLLYAILEAMLGNGLPLTSEGAKMHLLMGVTTFSRNMDPSFVAHGAQHHYFLGIRNMSVSHQTYALTKNSHLRTDCGGRSQQAANHLGEQRLVDQTVENNPQIHQSAAI